MDSSKNPHVIAVFWYENKNATEFQQNVKLAHSSNKKAIYLPLTEQKKSQFFSDNWQLFHEDALDIVHALQSFDIQHAQEE